MALLWTFLFVWLKPRPTESKNLSEPPVPGSQREDQVTGSAKRDLALYLLSKMDAADRIQQALAALGASGAEMKAASSR